MVSSQTSGADQRRFREREASIAQSSSLSVAIFTCGNELLLFPVLVVHEDAIEELDSDVKELPLTPEVDEELDEEEEWLDLSMTIATGWSFDSIELNELVDDRELRFN